MPSNNNHDNKANVDDDINFDEFNPLNASALPDEKDGDFIVNEEPDVADDEFIVSDKAQKVMDAAPIVEQEEELEDEATDTVPDEDVKSDEGSEQDDNTGGDDSLKAKEDPPEYYKQNVHMELDICIDSDIPEGEFAFSIPPRQEVDSPSDIVSPSEQDIKWDAARVAGYEARADGGTQIKAMAKGTWKQSIDFGDVKCKIRKGILNADPNKPMPLEDIALRIKSQLGTGGVIQVPLLNSGFYVTMAPVPEKQLSVVFNTILNDKYNMGRETFGASYNNNTYMTIKRFYNVILDSITDHTIKCSKKNLIKYIKRSDIDMLIWGFMACLYPKGHYYNRACTHDSDNCHHVKEGNLNLNNMLFIDDDKFTDEQRKHMSKLGSKIMSIDSVLKYQKSIDDQDRRVVEISDEDLKFTFSHSSLQDWFNDGDIWFDDMHKMVIEALGADPDEERREILMSQLAEVAELKSYTNTVEAVNSPMGYIKGSKRGIRLALEALSTSNDVTDKFIKENDKWVAECKRYHIGVENYVCPACGKPQLKEGEYIIPIDVLLSFFTMTLTRLYT